MKLNKMSRFRKMIHYNLYDIITFELFWGVLQMQYNNKNEELYLNFC